MDFITIDKAWAYLVLRYIVVAGGAYLIFWKGLRKYLAHKKIQLTGLRPNQIQKEILWSFSTMVIFGLNFILLKWMYDNDYTLIYSDISEHSWLYAGFSFILLMYLHDAYFYFTHKFLHRPFWYKHVHRVHHESQSPTPFTSFSFHPVEAIIQAGILPLSAVLFPTHYVVLFGFLTVSFLINVEGHLGFDFTPSWFPKHRFMGFYNTATHHDQHHKTTNYNFGLYFTTLDKVMGTLHPKYYELHKEVSTRVPESGESGPSLLGKTSNS